MPQLEDLDSDEPLPRRVQRHDFDRLIMLSDGVFAIAITLAAIEVHLPDAGSAGAVLRASTPVLLAYAISFTVIAAFWAGHRRLMARLARVDAVATLLQLVFLGLVALIPAATRMIVSAQIQQQDLYLLYLALIAACGVMQGSSWLYATAHPRLFVPGVNRVAAGWQAAIAFLTPTLSSTAALTLIRHPSKLSFVGLLAVAAFIRFSRAAISRRFPV